MFSITYCILLTDCIYWLPSMNMSVDENFKNLLESNPAEFLSELRQELLYFQRTKIVTLLDIYRIRKVLLPQLDVWLSSENLSYPSLLKLHENLLLHALRHETNLSDITQMVNENKYVLRNGIKTLIGTLPDHQ